MTDNRCEGKTDFYYCERALTVRTAPILYIGLISKADIRHIGSAPVADILSQQQKSVMSAEGIVLSRQWTSSPRHDVLLSVLGCNCSNVTILKSQMLGRVQDQLKWFKKDREMVGHPIGPIRSCVGQSHQVRLSLARGSAAKIPSES